MRFIETPLTGAFVIEPEPVEDERGSFARIFCRREFEAHGLALDIVQSNVSRNRWRGTLRGLHYQAPPYEEVKIVSCTQGSLFDVIVDIREGSGTRGRGFSVELSAERGNVLYVPKGFAHGFQTLVDETVVAYQMGEFYRPESARGIRWDDPQLAIPWPVPNPTVSPRDAGFAPLPAES